MLSDRAPGALQRLSRRLDASERVDVRALGEATPPSDTLVHVIAWAVVMVLVGLATWSWRSLVAGGVGVAVLSVLVEVAQGPLTATRNTELSDIAANLAGITAGLLVVITWSLSWSLLAGRREQADTTRAPVRSPRVER